MAPVATSEKTNGASNGNGVHAPPVKALFNPFYSPPAPEDSEKDKDYKYAQYKVSTPLRILRRSALITFDVQPRFPDVKWEPLGELEVTERAQFADPEKKTLFSAARKVKHLTPAIGTELQGIDLRQLSTAQKDEL